MKTPNKANKGEVHSHYDQCFPEAELHLFLGLPPVRLSKLKILVARVRHN